MRSLTKKGAMAALGISAVIFPVLTAVAVNISYGQPYTVTDSVSWAKADPNNPNTYTLGTVSMSVSDTVYTYTEDDCEGDWELVPGATVTTTNFDIPNGMSNTTFTPSDPVVTISGTETAKRVLNDVVMISKITGPSQRQLPDNSWVREILTAFQNWGFQTDTVVVTANNTEYPLYPPAIARVNPPATDFIQWVKGTPVPICTKPAPSISSYSSSSESSTSWNYSSFPSSVGVSSAMSYSSYGISSSASYCGDMICDATENAMNCSADCGYSYSSSY